MQYLYVVSADSPSGIFFSKRTAKAVARNEGLEVFKVPIFASYQEFIDIDNKKYLESRMKHIYSLTVADILAIHIPIALSVEGANSNQKEKVLEFISNLTTKAQNTAKAKNLPDRTYKVRINKYEYLIIERIQN